MWVHKVRLGSPIKLPAAIRINWPPVRRIKFRLGLNDRHGYDNDWLLRCFFGFTRFLFEFFNLLFQFFYVRCFALFGRWFMAGFGMQYFCMVTWLMVAVMHFPFGIDPTVKRIGQGNTPGEKNNPNPIWTSRHAFGKIKSKENE